MQTAVSNHSGLQFNPPVRALPLADVEDVQWTEKHEELADHIERRVKNTKNCVINLRKLVTDLYKANEANFHSANVFETLELMKQRKRIRMDELPIGYNNPVYITTMLT